MKSGLLGMNDFNHKLADFNQYNGVSWVDLIPESSNLVIDQVSPVHPELSS